MGFISAPVNLSSPEAIGSTTPNTGAFTTLSATPPANTTAFNSTGFSLTGANAQTLLNLAGTWNTSGTPTAFKLNVTDTASNSSSVLMDLQVGGVSKISARKDGRLIGPAGATFTIQSDVNIFFAINGGSANGWINGTAGVVWRGYLGIHSSNGAGAFEVAAHSGGSNIWEQRNSTSAQTFRLYRTYTDASNYERLGFIATRTTRFAIAAENAGTGAARSLEISFYTSASDPTSTDITSGCFSVWKNSGTGTIKLWANDGGTMKSVALA